MIKKMLCWCILAFLALSCEESFVTPDPETRGFNYYPLEVGNYRIYDVTDIKYQHNEPTELHFQMREWVADSFLDQTNSLTYKIIRSVRPNAESPWEDDSVMTVTKSHTNVVLMKDNTKYVKMVFPVEEGKTWIGDMYNDHIIKDDKSPYKGKEIYEYEAVNQPYTLNEISFDSTVTVVQGEPWADHLLLDDRREVYAKHVGRVYRLFNRIKYCSGEAGQTCTVDTGYILDGHTRIEELIEYGKL